MRTLIIIAALTLLPAGYTKADTYHWKDKKGVVHITDSLEKVPEEYKNKVKVRKTPPAAQAVETGAPEAARTAQPSEAEELFGDHPLDWWRDAFTMNKNEISGIEASIAEKKRFNSTFEVQKRTKRLYDANDLQTYERYLQEIPSEESQLVKLQAERAELVRKATNAGVPRSIRGE